MSSTASSTPIQIIGNLTGDPELRYTSTGRPVANFAVAVNHRRQDQAGAWVDDGTTFYPVTAWGDLAENTAVSLTVGARVVVLGRIRSRSFETASGERRTRMEVVADEVTPSLRYATATVTKTTRTTTDTSAGPGEAGEHGGLGDDLGDGDDQAPF